MKQRVEKNGENEKNEVIRTIHAQMIKVPEKVIFDYRLDGRAQFLHREWRVVGEVGVDAERTPSSRR